MSLFNSPKLLIESLFFLYFFVVLRFAEDGGNFSINSDDPLVCQTRMDLEQGVAFNEIGLSPAEITRAVSLRFLLFKTS